MGEHCVKVYLRLSANFGSEEEIEAIHDFCNTLEEVLARNGVGDFDGDEFGGGECTLYMYGADADRLFEAIRRPLQGFPLARGGYVIKRYGPPQAGVSEIQIEL